MEEYAREDEPEDFFCEMCRDRSDTDNYGEMSDSDTNATWRRRNNLRADDQRDWLCGACHDEVCSVAPAKREIVSAVFLLSTDDQVEKTVHVGAEMAVAGVINKIRVDYESLPFTDTAMVWLDCERGKVEFPLVHITAVVYGV